MTWLLGPGFLSYTKGIMANNMPDTIYLEIGYLRLDLLKESC